MNTVLKGNTEWLPGDSRVASVRVISSHHHVAAGERQLAVAAMLPITRPGGDQNSNFKVQFLLNTVSRHRKAEKSDHPKLGAVYHGHLHTWWSPSQQAHPEDQDHFRSCLHL